MRDVEGNEAELLFYIVHQEGLVHDIYGAVGDELLEVIGKSFASEVDTFDGVVEGEVLEDGGSVGEREAAVNHEAALSRTPRDDVAAAGLVKVGQGGGIGDVKG